MNEDTGTPKTDETISDVVSNVAKEPEPEPAPTGLTKAARPKLDMEFAVPVSGVQGFLDFNEPLVDKLHLPHTNPISVVVLNDKNEPIDILTWREFDASEYREGLCEISCSFALPGSVEFDVGRIHAFLAGLSASENAFDEFVSLWELVAGDQAEAALAKAVDACGGAEGFTSALKSLYS